MRRREFIKSAIMGSLALPGIALGSNMLIYNEYAKLKSGKITYLATPKGANNLSSYLSTSCRAKLASNVEANNALLARLRNA